MRDNQVKRKLQQGGVSMGVMCMEFATPGFGRISAEGGAEFVVIDMEHTGWSLETVKMLIATSRAADVVPLVRPPVGDYHFIAHALDVGAMGLVLPLVATAPQARNAVDCAMYPPRGRRGCAFAVAHDDFKGGDLTEKMRHSNDNLLTVALIETEEGIRNLDEIAAVDGIDALWIGQFDLTVSMGIPGQFDHPKFIQATKKLLETCRKHGKVPAQGMQDADQLAAAPAEGYRMLTYVADLWVYQQALRRCFKKIREKLGDPKAP